MFRWPPEAGFPGAIHIASRNARLVSSDLVSATADLDLNLAGPLARAPKISGAVTFNTLEVNVPDRLPASLKPLPDTKHLDPKSFAREMLALQGKRTAAAARPSSFAAALDLKISAPNRIFVRGRGIDAEFGGDLRIAGAMQKPVVTGAFDLRRGRLQLLTQRIDITRGKLTFAGGLTPELDFYAETTAGDVTARIAVSGPAAQPSFAFTSVPELPQDEVLSRCCSARRPARCRRSRRCSSRPAWRNCPAWTSGRRRFRENAQGAWRGFCSISTRAAPGGQPSGRRPI